MAEPGSGAGKAHLAVVPASRPAARPKLYELVNHRVNHHLPAVVTSNWTEREFAQYRSRIVSRPKDEVHVHISAPDARGRIKTGC